MGRKMLVGVLLSAILLALILYRIDYGELTAALRSVHVPTLLAGALVLLSTLVIRSWRWHYLLAPLKSIRMGPLLSATTIGAMLDMLMPARFGDIVRGVLIGQREQISKISSLATIVVEKMFDILTLAVIALLLVVYLGFSAEKAILPYGFGATVTTAVALLILGGTVLWLIQARIDFVVGVTQRLFGWLPASWLEMLVRGLRAFSEGLQGMNRGPYLPQVLLLSMLLWSLFAFSNYLILRSFGLQLPPYAAVLILIFQILGVTLPSSPGFIGTYHAAVVVAFGILGVTQEQALGVAITMHAAFFFPYILAGLLFLWKENLSFQQLLSLRTERPDATTGWQAESQQEIQRQASSIPMQPTLHCVRDSAMAQTATVFQPSNAGVASEQLRSAESSTAAHVYLGAICQETARVISLMDREPFSPTLGCMDRTYWAWKFTDFPGARFQEGLCVLSFLYATPFDGNELYQQPKLLQWIASGLDYWVHIQYPGGDFDEAYPYERSLAATAFTAFYLSEANGFLGDQLPEDTARNLEAALARAGDWLVRNDETHGFLSNHLAAAAAALLHIYRITKGEKYLERSRYFLGKILDHQSVEGWYEEYGGADPGYQTHGTFYLARYWQLMGELELDPAQKSELGDSLSRSLEFLAHFVHPDGSIGGEYASRNTQTYYPAAFEMLSGVNGSAHWIAAEMLPSVQDASAAGLRTVDVYNYFPMLNNNVFAYLACLQEGNRTAPAKAPSPEPSQVYFPEAGILKVRTARYDAYVGLNKGGVIKAYTRSEDRAACRLFYSDCGYIGRLRNGKLFSSQWFDDEAETEVQDRELVVDSWFYQISKPIMSPFRFIGFRGFSMTVGRLPKVSYWLKSILVRTLIYRKRRLDIRFKRTVSFSDEQFVVEDRLQGGIGGQIESLAWRELFTTIHMGSSRYFIPNELTPTAADDYQMDIDPAKLEEGVTLKRVVELK